MTLPPLPQRRWLVFAAICIATLAVEVYVVFIDREDTFTIEGRQLYEVEPFARGVKVSHAFLMQGDGFYRIHVLLNSTAATEARLRWTLWRGSVDAPPITPAGGDERQLTLRPGRQWQAFDVVRDGSSNDRWYTIELQLLQPHATLAEDGRPTGPHVTVVASNDNPDRGGVLWVDAARKPGSLVMRADRRARTLYDRFQTEAAPHLPAPLRIEAVQWLAALAFHLAFVAFAYGVFREAWAASPDRVTLSSAPQ